MQRFIRLFVVLAVFAMAPAFTSSATAEVLTKGFTPSQKNGWSMVQQGVYRKSGFDGEIVTYTTGIEGAIYRLDQLTEQLRNAQAKSPKILGRDFYEADALRLRGAIDSIRQFLNSSSLSKVRERDGKICNDDLAWTLETSAINSSAYGYAVWAMLDPSANTATKDLYTFASLKYAVSGGSDGYEDSDYQYIPVGVYAEIDSSAGVSGYGLPLLNLYSYASAWTTECGSFFESMDSNYNY